MKSALPPRSGTVSPSAARGMAAVLVLVSGAFLVAGCASSGSGAGNSLGAQALQNLSPFEKRVLKDKYVTQAEFDESMQVYTECLAAAGIQYEIKPGEVGMGSVLMYNTGSPGPDSTTFDEDMRRCVDQVSAVQNVWILQNQAGAAGTATTRAMIAGAQPLPGLQKALDGLDTSGW